MAVTNTGSLYRYRGQVMFVPLILIAARQVQRRVARRPQPVPALVARAPAQR
jgi:hypothetical protein